MSREGPFGALLPLRREWPGSTALTLSCIVRTRLILLTMLAGVVGCLSVGVVLVAGGSDGASVVATTTTVVAPGTLGPPGEVGEKAAAAAALVGCAPDAEMNTCLLRAVVDEYATKGVRAAYDEVATMSKTAAPDPFPCHGLMHRLGREAVLKHSPAELLSFDTGVCRFGFVHGVVESYGLNENVEALTRSFSTLCDTASDSVRQECAHAAGHAAAIGYKSSIYDAYGLCDTLRHDGKIDEKDQIACGGGVIMSFGFGRPAFDETSSTRWIRVDKSQADGLCTKVRSLYKESCWAGLWLLYATTPELGGSGALLETCQLAGVEIDGCLQGVGKVLRDELGSDQAAIAACPTGIGQFADDQYVSCIYGVVWAAANEEAAFGGTLSGYDSKCELVPEIARQRCAEAESLAFAQIAAVPVETARS